MTGASVLILLLQAAPPPAAEGTEVRSVSIVVTDDKSGPVEGLVPEEVAILENGLARDLVSLQLDHRPLTVALLVDTTEVTSPFFRSTLVDAVAGFLTRLPADTKYALWTTGDRPTKLVDYTDDLGAGGKALRRVATTGGNTMLDALVEASADLKKQEGKRTALVAVTALGIEFSSRDRYQVPEAAAKNVDLFLGLEIAEGDAGSENRILYEYAFGELAKRTGGMSELTLSSLGADQALRKLSAFLRAQYRLSYATLTGLKNRKIEVKVARPGVKVKVGPSQARES
jgi:VWFA-related protein